MGRLSTSKASNPEGKKDANKVSGRLLDAYFNRAFYKQILGKSVDIRDLESIDPEFHKSLQWMLDNDITGVIDVSGHDPRRDHPS